MDAKEPASDFKNSELTLGEPQPAQTGTLYVVGTPIGNLRDLTPRAVDLFRTVDCVACEDTRVTGSLLKRLGIQVPLLSCRDQNEAARASEITQLLGDGKAVALVSDAGTPAISDPGFRVVRACRKAGLPVVPVSGPVAATTALSASGLPSDSFVFSGFLPPKTAARKRYLQEQAEARATLILYESPHRILKFLDDILEVLGGERVIAVARELTKRHETIHVGSAFEVRKQVGQGSLKGEFVLLIAKKGFEL